MVEFTPLDDHPRDQDLCVAWQGPSPGLFLTQGTTLFFRRTELPALAWDRQVCLGTKDGTPLWALEIPAGAELSGAPTVSLREALMGDEDQVQTLLRAVPLVHWMKTHRFCGLCASPTQRRSGEFVLVCSSCGHEFYPRINPAIIVLVHDGNKALLARHHRYGSVFTCVAGFVESGETLEETVRREVREEVGVEIGPPQYQSSQSWPFANNLMLGFTAPYAGGEIRPDGVEILEARWFSKDELPDLPPGISIAKRLIRSFFDRQEAPRG